MDVPGASPASLFDESGQIIADVSCRRCGYNLRGLREDGRCPECGTPIGLSTQGDLLRFADPAWVEKVALGAKCMVWGLVLSIAVGFLGGCLTGAAGGRPVIENVINILGGLLGLYGAWLLTSPDPSGIGEDRYATARSVVRFGLLVGLLNEILVVIRSAAPGLPTTTIGLLMAVAVGAVLVEAAAEFAKFFYLEKLADRIPDNKLARQACFLRWAVAITLALTGIVGGITVIVGPANPALAGGSMSPGPAGATTAPATSAATGPASSAIGIPGLPAGGAGWSSIVALGCVVMVAFLVFSIMVLVLLVRIGRRFREQAEIARTTWASATLPGQSPPPPSDGSSRD